MVPAAVPAHALTEASENLWFIIHRLAPMNVDELIRADDEMVLGLGRLSRGVEASYRRWSRAIEMAPFKQGVRRL